MEIEMLAFAVEFRLAIQDGIRKEFWLKFVDAGLAASALKMRLSLRAARAGHIIGLRINPARKLQKEA